MACNVDFVQFIVDQCSGAGDITVRKMMGDYCIYCNGVLFGLICDNNFYVKVTLPELLSPKARSRKQARKNRQVPLSLDEVIAPDLVCSQDLRAFFQQHLGPDFRFKVEFQDWLHRNAGLSFRDAVEAYKQFVQI